jgi:hypothetical protein
MDVPPDRFLTYDTTNYKIHPYPNQHLFTENHTHHRSNSNHHYQPPSLFAKVDTHLHPITMMPTTTAPSHTTDDVPLLQPLHLSKLMTLHSPTTGAKPRKPAETTRLTEAKPKRPSVPVSKTQDRSEGPLNLYDSRSRSIASMPYLQPRISHDRSSYLHAHERSVIACRLDQHTGDDQYLNSSARSTPQVINQELENEINNGLYEESLPPETTTRTPTPRLPPIYSQHSQQEVLYRQYGSPAPVPFSHNSAKEATNMNVKQGTDNYPRMMEWENYPHPQPFQQQQHVNHSSQAYTHREVLPLLQNRRDSVEAKHDNTINAGQNGLCHGSIVSWAEAVGLASPDLDQDQGNRLNTDNDARNSPNNLSDGVKAIQRSKDNKRRHVW